MKPPSRRLVVAVSLLLPAAATAQERPAREQPFEETIEVVESSAVVELPRGADEADPDDLLLLEAGIPREVVRVESLAEEEWQLLLWIDGPLCHPAAFERTLVALAGDAERLTARGAVRVVVAGPEPRTVVAATREPLLVAEQLVALARGDNPCRARIDELLWEARRAGTREAGERALVTLRTLLEERHAALRAALRPCPGGACALLLVAHGYPTHADLALPTAMRPADGPQRAAAIEEATEALARDLAVARWAVVALPFAPPPPAGGDEGLPPGAVEGPSTAPPSAIDPRSMYRVWPLPRGREHHRELPAASWDVYTLPELAALRVIADVTAGMVLRAPEQLPAALESLGARVRVWYRTAVFTTGERRSLEVLTGAYLRPAAAPAWVGPPAEPQRPARSRPQG